MTTTTARLDTEHPERFIKQLVSHLGNRLETSAPDPRHGSVHMPDGGTCELTADATGISLSAEAATDDDLARIQDVVARHLLRFTDIPALTTDWAPAA
jgi:hypothetical protein